MPADVPNANDEPQRVAAFRLIEQCLKHGLTQFFVAPGSRSTPLTVAIANHPHAKVATHFDERGLAFACLGYGRATRKAGVFVCTSGTAVANALPAVIEASLDHVPMLLLTADRPPELRDAGANQTIDQVKIFGSTTRWAFDLPCASAESLASDLKVIDSSIRHAKRVSRLGPVHLNCMFREPFEVRDELDSDVPLELAAVSVSDAKNITEVSTKSVGLPAQAIQIPSGDCLVSVGGATPRATRAAVELATRLACPVVTDVTCGGDCSSEPHHINQHDFVLLDSELPAPDTVIHVGDRMVSKRWLQFLERCPPKRYVLLTEHEHRYDPTHQVTDVVYGDLVANCEAAVVQETTSRPFTERWLAAAKRVKEQACEALNQMGWSEPTAMRQITRELPPSHALFLGNSLPIRLCDWFGLQSTPHVAANRGASGIDGLICSSVGYALGLQRPVTAILGDLSTLHDLNGLSLLAQSTVPVHLVVFNNDGGGIFHLLPVATQTQHFERLFAMPHGHGFEDVSRMFRLDYARVDCDGELQRRLERIQTAPVSSITELIFDREETATCLREIAASIRESLGGGNDS